jgi:hypothetical protein
MQNEHTNDAFDQYRAGNQELKELIKARGNLFITLYKLSPLEETLNDHLLQEQQDKLRQVREELEQIEVVIAALTAQVNRYAEECGQPKVLYSRIDQTGI